MNTAKFNVLELKKLIKPLHGVINSSTVLPILENVLMVFRPSGCNLTVTDLETVVVANIVCECTEFFQFTIHFKEFKLLVDNCGAEQLTLEYDAKNKKAVFSAKDPAFKVGIMIESADDYPKHPSTEPWVVNETFDVKELSKPLLDAIQFCSNDDLRPSMTGVFFDMTENHMQIIATDAHRLIKKHVITFPSKKSKDSVRTGILPKKSAMVLCNVFRDGQITYRLNSNRTCVFNETYTMWARNIDARYPDWTAVWPKELSYSFVAKRKQLAAMLTLAMPFSNRSTRQVCLSITTESIKVESQDVDFSMEFEGSIPTYMPVCPSGVYPEFAMDNKFLSQAIKISKDENIKIQYESGKKAFIIDDDILIMPLMLNN